MSVQGSGFTNLEAFWSDDFAPLESAGKAMLTKMREDEGSADADLYRRICSSGSGSHRYFSSKEPLRSLRTNGHHQPEMDSLSCPTIRLAHRKSAPLPTVISTEFKKVISHSFMGLLPEAELAWMSVDDKLFIWPYNGPHSTSYCKFTTPSGQCILSVGLVRPKKGVFIASVRWCLVITTPDEILLCALASSSGGNGFAHRGGVLRVVPTDFTLPTDGIRMLAVCGSKTGRIFLGGEDGCLYEMTYESLADNLQGQPPNLDNVLDEFYDGDKLIPPVLSDADDSSVAKWVISSGKRALNSAMMGASASSRPRKSRKLVHSNEVPRFARAVVPAFLLKASSYVLGLSTGGGTVTKIALDEERRCLYTLSAKGTICAYLIEHGDSKAVKLVSAIDIVQTARLYLEAVARGQMFPPSSYSSAIGNIAFPGGGSAAQAGVGGMEGARAILKQADRETRRNGDGATGFNYTLMPSSLQVVSANESTRLVLMAVTKGGLRYYMSTYTSSRVGFPGPSRDVSRDNHQQSFPSTGKLSLCHIRSPPPLGQDGLLQEGVDVDSEIGASVGGTTPRVSDLGHKILHVDASFCSHGTTVLALDYRDESFAGRSASQYSESRTGGNLIVGVAPDYVARTTASPLSISTTESQKLTPPGGLSEAISLPILSAQKGIDGARNPVLPGGVVWDIALITQEESPVLDLALHSKTPTDNELSVGLLPAYTPVADKPRNVGDSRKPAPGIKSTNALSKRTSMSVLLNIMSRTIMSRTMDFHDPSNKHESRYRISSRSATNGFSLSAADSNRGRGTGTGSKVAAARLNPWLLRPSVIPLNSFAVQHLLPTKHVVAVNSGGIHFFEFSTILSCLMDALSEAGANVDTDRSVTNFFKGYGHAEGCAMCIFLAIGCGPSRGATDTKSRASRAALARAFVPKLEHTSNDTLGDSNGIVNESLSVTDKCLPPGYVFRPSALSEGVTKVFARLMRSIWFKPMVVITEGRKVRPKWSSAFRFSPAKVELLLDSDTLEQIRKPLHNLQELMKEMFSPAIKTVPGKTRKDNNMMDVDDDGGQYHYVTRTLLHRNHLMQQGSGGEIQLPPSESEAIACLTEERHLHSLYRLLSRSVQLLALLALLRRAHDTPGLPEVDWGLLHGLTFSQLAQTRDGQERIEKLLNALVTVTESSAGVVGAPAADADKLSTQFSNECYLFFSQGSRFSYNGFRAATEALSCPFGSTKRNEMTKKAAENFQVAARHWHNKAIISGRLFHAKQKEEYDKIVQMAISGKSPLAKAVAVLVKLGDVVSVVHICLITASNFDAKADGSRSSNTPMVKANDILPWEQGLYHQKRTTLENTETESSLSASGGMALGAAVTADDAKETCYAFIFETLSSLLREGKNDLAWSMVKACCAQSEKSFLRFFFRYLLSHGHTETLLQIESPDLEEWLRLQVNDPLLLWRYFIVQEKFYGAGKLSLDYAINYNSKLPLQERMEYLTRALNAFKSAAREKNPAKLSWMELDGTRHVVDQEELNKEMTIAQDALDIARIQNRLLSFVMNCGNSKITEDKAASLATSIMSVSDLYNLYAAPCKSFDICLLIIHACRKDDTPLITKLWKSVIYEELLPCATRNERTYFALQEFSEGCLVDDDVQLLRDQQANINANLPLFESGAWISRVMTRVIGLGKEVYRKGADFVFPVEFILSELEHLRQLQNEASSDVSGGQDQMWSLDVLLKVGVPYFATLGCYESFVENEEQMKFVGGDSFQRRRVEQLSSSVDLLYKWVRACTIGSSGSSSDEALKELVNAEASGLLKPKLNALKAKLEALSHAMLREKFDLVEREIYVLLMDRPL